MVTRWEISDITDLNGAVILLVQTDWSEIPPDWQVFLLWGILVIIPDFHKLGIPNAIVSFSIRGNILVPTAHHPQSSPEPLCLPHSASTIWRKLSSSPSAAYYWPTGNPCITNTLNSWMAEILVCICPLFGGSGQLSNWSESWIQKQIYLRSEIPFSLTFRVTILVSNYLALHICPRRSLNYKILPIDWDWGSVTGLGLLSLFNSLQTTRDEGQSLDWLS